MLHISAFFFQDLNLKKESENSAVFFFSQVLPVTLSNFRIYKH